MYTYDEALKASAEYFNGDDLAAKVFCDKYALRDKNDELLESTPEDMHWRMAKEFARIQKSKYSKPMTKEEIFNYFDKFKYICPQGSPMFGIGNKYSITALSNCYVLKGPSYDSYSAILNTDEQLVNISKRRGGVGICLDVLRPSGTPIKNAAKTSSGISSWMDRYSNSIREVGQCVAYNQRVLTSTGLLEISKVTPDQMVWTKEGWVRVDKTIYSGKKEVYRVTTDAGYTIESSLDHIYQTENDGLLTETKLSDLEAGDRVCLNLGNASHSSNNIRLQDSGYSNSNNKPANCNLPEILSIDLAYLLGYSYGDGCVCYNNNEKYGLSLACSNDYPKIKEKLDKYCFDTFDYRINYRYGDGDLEVLSIYNKTIIEFLEHNSLLKQKSKDIKFPDLIEKASPEVQASFIAGYFDADGYASDGKKGYCFASISLEFLKSIQIILSTFGIASKIHFEDRSKQGWNTLYSLVVVGKASQERFVDNINESIKVVGSKHVSKRDCWLTPFKAKSFDIKYNNISYCPDNSQNLSLSTAIKLKVDNNRVNTNLVIDTIAKIEFVGSIDCYDLVLESEHLFWCEGFYIHNSGRRGALMLTLSVHHPDILEFATVKNDDTKVTGANISVCLTDEFRKALKEDSDYELRWPVDSKKPTIKKKISAKKVWDVIINSAWQRAEPGLLNWDEILRGPADCYDEYRSLATNPSLRAGTLILTEDGPVAIDDLEDAEFKVYNMNGGFSDAVCRLSGKNKRLYEVVLSTGFSYFATAEHRWATRDGEKTTLELVPKDKLPVLKKSKVFNGTLGDEDDGFLIGWLLGDGWITTRSDNNKKQYGFIVSEQDYTDGIALRIEKILTEKVGFEGKFNRRDRNGSTWYEINSARKSLHEYMSQFYNPNKKDGINKNLFRYASEEFMRGLIDGYLSSDGHVSNNNSSYINFTCKYHKLISDISEILGFYGISTSLQVASNTSTFPNGVDYEKEYIRHDLRIVRKKDIEHFGSLFKITSKKKQSRLDYLCETEATMPDLCRSEISVVEVVETDLYEDVWDITVDDDQNCFSLSHCVTHNCSEIPLSAHDSCRLMAINLLSYVNDPFTETATFDYEKFYEHTQIAQRLMDDLVDLESEKIQSIIDKIDSDPEPEELKRNERDMWISIKRFNDEGRRTGLGITALGDTIAALGVKYGSEKSILITGEIYKHLKLGAYRASVDMAKELGPFSAWDADKEKNNEFLNRINEEDETIFEEMQTYGRRNISLLTTAPTGSLSILTQTSSGIEPVFMLSYTRRKKGNPGDNNFRVDFVDQNGDSWQEFTVYHKAVKDWMNITGEKDITKSPWYNSCANDIDWEGRVNLQAAAGKHICHAISSTINLPAETTEETVSNIYNKAFDLGLKGITIYREGCRTGVMVDSKKTNTSTIKKRPTDVPADVHHISVKGDPYFVLIGVVDGKPYEVFSGKNGFIDSKVKKCVIHKVKRPKCYKAEFDDGSVLQPITAMCSDEEEALSRMISMSLRHDVEIQYVVDQLQKTKGSMTTLAKAVARALKAYVPEGSKSSQKCPECGSNLIFIEGCQSCSCGFSKCG
jgi:ribonucleotide reductase alpha subunit